MKKLLALAVVMTLVLTGCGKETSKTCSTEESGIHMDATMTAKGDVLETLNMKMTIGASSLGIGSITDLDDTQKEQLKSLYLSAFGVDENTKGLKIDVDFGEDLILTIDIDLDKVEKDTLKNFSLDVKDEKYSLKKSVEKFEESGYTCK